MSRSTISCKLVQICGCTKYLDAQVVYSTSRVFFLKDNFNSLGVSAHKGRLQRNQFSGIWIHRQKLAHLDVFIVGFADDLKTRK